MAVLWKELRKLYRQIRGQENIFGYKSTAANQLFLLYCFNGKIFFTDKIHPQVKNLWFGSLVFEVLVCYSVVISNLWYGLENDFMTYFDVINLLGVCNTVVFGFPLVVYWFRADIESMIEAVDEIYASKSSSHWIKYPNIMNVKEVLFWNVRYYCKGLAMNFIYLFDATIFFSEQKIDNRYYYPMSVPLVENFRSSENYFVFNCLMNIILTQVVIQGIVLSSFILYWGMTCSSALICIADDIDAALGNLNSRYVELKGTDYEIWHRYFSGVLIKNIKRFQKIIRIIDHFRGFFQLIGTVMIPATFFVAVAQLHVATSANLSPVLKLKSLATCFLCVWFVLLLYWTAEKLDNSISALSMTVYSTPWYRSVKPRKLVYIFLCQTQKMKNLKIINVYLLSLKNFSKYLHGIWTYTNALHKLT